MKTSSTLTSSKRAAKFSMIRKGKQVKQINEMKQFMKDNPNAVSYSFTMKLYEYNIIANILMNHFKEIRVDKRKGEVMPYKERKENYKGWWIQLTISKL